MKAAYVIETERAIVKNKEETGTFYASTIVWSGENKDEVFLQGKVSIKLCENNLKGDGAFSFLRLVQLLIINDKAATLAAVVELSKQPYHLTRLNNKEATIK